MLPLPDNWPVSKSQATSNSSSKSTPLLKKPRHRHTPAQLAALNELYEKNEHPPLELRISLAGRLGMETKTVNAWFQNKRASSRKRTRSVPYTDPHSISVHNAASVPSSTIGLRRPAEFDDYHDDEISSLDLNQSRMVPNMSQQYQHPLYYPGNGDPPHFMAEPDSLPRKMRMRPTQEQTEQLKKLYNITPHPTPEQRQVLSERIGMRYQSITNWFQNQRSLAKKKNHDDLDSPVKFQSDYVLERQYSAYPPPVGRPSLVSPPHYSIQNAAYPAGRRSPSVSIPLDESTARKSLSRRSAARFDVSPESLRPRRSRPEPYQLHALKELFTKTPTPSIEERSALAAEIGMDIGKVTNWFRNLRQTARKRVKRSGSSEEDDDPQNFDAGDMESTFFSRSVTPSQHSSVSANEGHMDVDDSDNELHQSDMGSDDEYQEAVTPSPGPSPLVAATSASSRVSFDKQSTVNISSYPELEKTTKTQFPGIRIEDALLLLSFHQHVVH
ncbi:hypothetical protein AMATHDRAFT_57354 [Amanita thiersii Skay4041]|uniref:Homeobox domain-containing protein n=1 Tax=Amanita thiersii Skay4041 TaxID=703135 RepID=A0A2A9NWY4_9AGAR|nr:hypothetical protein AMATHDRAFT_57354 [Amanita thiersii Skay4041]